MCFIYGSYGRAVNKSVFCGSADWLDVAELLLSAIH